ncbi:MAG: FecR family protein [Bacteroidetes bacterium]|nr:FecR family protein [Bacteroidota bacterium]
MEQDHIWELVAKKLSGEAGEEELQELKQLLRNHPDLHYPIQYIIDLWKSDTTGFKSGDAHEAFNRHVERMEEHNVSYSEPTFESSETLERDKTDKNPHSFFWLLLSVAAFASAVFLGLHFMRSQPIPSASISPVSEKKISEVFTKNGSKTNLILPDGTKVWLNAGSSLKYDSTYGKTIREVVLSGEAFFDVVKNKEKPFIIHASRINIKVLGTKFNVRSYPTDKTTEAALIRGSIEVTFKDRPNKKVILKPNEKIVVQNTAGKDNIIETAHQGKTGKMPVATPEAIVEKLTYEHKTGAVIETSWVNDRLVFQDESFQDLAMQLERWYGVTVKFENQQLKENHLTGSFKTETIRQALDALKFTAPFNYEIDNNNIVTIY